MDEISTDGKTVPDGMEALKYRYPSLHQERDAEKDPSDRENTGWTREETETAGLTRIRAIRVVQRRSIPKTLEGRNTEFRDSVDMRRGK